MLVTVGIVARARFVGSVARNATRPISSPRRRVIGGRG